MGLGETLIHLLFICTLYFFNNLNKNDNFRSTNTQLTLNMVDGGRVFPGAQKCAFSGLQ